MIPIRGKPARALAAALGPRPRETRTRGKGHRPSELALELIAQIRHAGLPAPEPEFRFCARRWRLDVAWPRLMLAVEVQGGTWSGGSHVRGKAVENDCCKLNEAVLLGWRILLVTTDMVSDGRALRYVERALRGEVS